MTRMMWWLAALAVTLATATCAVKTERQEAFRAGSDVPTAEDFPAPLIINGVKGCAKVTKFDGIETCPSLETLAYLCARKSDDLPVAPPGATTCGTVTIVGGQCRPDKQLVRYQCAAVVGMPTASPSPVPTPSPDQNPLAACQEKRPGFCWTRGAFSDGQCFASCECGPRLANTVCVGPVWGAPTPRPTQKPTPRPTGAPTASPSPAVDPLAPCRDGRVGYCWTDGLFAGNDCFSRCACAKRDANTVCVGPGAATATPRPTASPRPTATPTVAPTRTPAVTATAPPIACPVGQHAELRWSCVADPTPAPVVTARPTPSPSASPRSTSSPRPTASPVPTKVPNSHALAGVWFVPECTRPVLKDNAVTGRERWYDWPYVWAAYPKGWNKHVTDFGAPCVPTQEVWAAGINIPNYWENDVSGNIMKAQEASKPVIDALRERKQQIADMRTKGVPEEQLPKMPILWIAETASSGYGYFVDLGDGFYTEANGKRTIRDAKTLPKVFPPHVEWLIETYKKEGVTEFADAPYLFLWAASNFAAADNPSAASPPVKPDFRGRTYQINPPVKATALRGTGSAWMKAQLTKNNPTLWPSGYEWKVNPDNWPNSIYSNLDTPDAAAAKRDAGYYLLYLYALKGQHPEVTHVTPQISNCGYNKPNDSPWWDVSRMVQQFNRIFGYPPEAQIEGCQAGINMAAGRAPFAPFPDCRAYQSIKVFAGGRVSMWLPNVQDAVGLDKQLLQCPMVLQNTALTLPQTVSIVDDLLLKATPGM